LLILPLFLRIAHRLVVASLGLTVLGTLGFAGLLAWVGPSPKESSGQRALAALLASVLKGQG
jgi:hypothetical protein